MNHTPYLGDGTTILKLNQTAGHPLLLGSGDGWMEIKYLLKNALKGCRKYGMFFCFFVSFPYFTSRPSNVCLMRSGKYVVQYQKFENTTGVIKGTWASEIK